MIRMLSFFLSALSALSVLQQVAAQPPVDLHQEVVRVLAAPARGHLRTKADGIQLRLRNVVVDSSLLWFHLQLYNSSHIVFRPAYCRFVARDRPKAKRVAHQSVELVPYRRPLLGTVRYHHRYDLLVPFWPFALPGKTRLLIQVGEASSGRVLTLVIPAKTILRAIYLH